ncbi:MAG: hypothetical protein II122_04475 [Bacteroidaceae bacterium]|jgi:hypothetical protein|nr:hypothetical protein [Bacteroidaceae bacterium]
MNRLLFIFLLLPVVVFAQQTVTYEGLPIGKTNTLKVTQIGYLDTSFKSSFQGMEIYKKYLLSLQHCGMATMYKTNGKTIKKIGRFKLGSFDDQPKTANHANVASFSKQFLNKGDKLPLVYVTRCNASNYGKGMQQVLFVEHVDPVKMTSECVQTISFDDRTLTTLHTTQWCVDVENGMLYGLSNSKEKSGNRHQIVKFRLPAYNGPQDSIVILRDEDVLERYFMEDYYKKPDWQPVIQGMFIRDNLLYLPWGVGSKSNPSVLYIWDLKNRVMRNAINLQKEIPHEMEDCAFYDKNNLIIQAQKRLYRITFK